MTLLLDHCELKMEERFKEDILIAAAGNPLWGLEILAFLRDRGYSVKFSKNVFAAAERNIWCGKEVVAFLLRHPDSSYEVTESSGDEDSEFSHDVDGFSVTEEGSSDDTEIPGGEDSSEDVYETAVSE
jgi:hypothetical protein